METAIDQTVGLHPGLAVTTAPIGDDKGSIDIDAGRLAQ
jgi:hypothetical protein